MKKIVVALLIVVLFISGLSTLSLAEDMVPKTVLVVFYSNGGFKILIGDEMARFISQLIPEGTKTEWGDVKIFCATQSDKMFISYAPGKCQK